MPESIAPVIDVTNGRLRLAAVLVGDRIDLRGVAARVGGQRPVLPVDGGGFAVAFRYGALVFVDVTPAAREQFITDLTDRIITPYEPHVIEEIDLLVRPDRDEGVSGNDISVTEASVERIVLAAEILAKSVALERYEVAMTNVFQNVEPLAQQMEERGVGLSRSRRLVRQLGRFLLMQHTMIGRVEVGEKPDLLWERPDMERLYLRLEDEFELRERHNALERKLDLVSRTTSTLIDLLQARRTLHVEWLIVILIAIEIVMGLYELAMRT